MSSASYHPLRHNSFHGLIGISQVDITPPINIYSRNWGAAKHDVASGIHQPLKLTCITFKTSETGKPLVLIGADLACINNAEDEHEFRSQLLKNFSLDIADLMFCCTHTHAGPVVSRSHSNKPGGEYIEDYLGKLGRATRDAINNSVSSAVPAVLTWHYGKCQLATNRDLPDKNKNRFVVGFNPAQKADDTLLVGRITNEQGNIIGTIVNYACHPTTLAWDNHLISPDFIGSMRELVEKNTDAPCLFLQGASGELSPAQQYSGDVQVAEKNGRQLGYAVLATLEDMLPPKMELVFAGIVESGAPLATWQLAEYQVPRQLSAEYTEVPFNLKHLPSLNEIEQEYNNCQDRTLQERLLRKRSVRKAVGDGETSAMPLWVWQLGDSFIIGQPNEAYSDFQLEVRKQFPSRAIALGNLVNGGTGYLPPSQFYDKDIYQEWQTPFAAGSLELLISTTTGAIKKLLQKNIMLTATAKGNGLASSN